MSKRDESVPRPLKRVEWEIVYASREASKGWTDMLATARNAAVDAWETLTREPTTETERLYQLKDEFAFGIYQGQEYPRYQYKVTNGGRIWYFVDPALKGSKTAGRILLERCSTTHPKETQ